MDTKKLDRAAELIEEFVADLNITEAPCPHCGSKRAEDWNEKQAAVELEAAARKVRRWAASLKTRA